MEHKNFITSSKVTKFFPLGSILIFSLLLILKVSFAQESMLFSQNNINVLGSTTSSNGYSSSNPAGNNSYYNGNGIYSATFINDVTPNACDIIKCPPTQTFVSDSSGGLCVDKCTNGTNNTQCAFSSSANSNSFSVSKPIISSPNSGSENNIWGRFNSVESVKNSSGNFNSLGSSSSSNPYDGNSATFINNITPNACDTIKCPPTQTFVSDSSGGLCVDNVCPTGEAMNSGICKKTCQYKNVCNKKVSGIMKDNVCAPVYPTIVNNSCVSINATNSTVSPNGGVKFAWSVEPLASDIISRCGFVDSTTGIPKSIAGLERLNPITTEGVPINNIQNTSRFSLVCKFFKISTGLSAGSDAAANKWIRVLRTGIK